MRLAHYRIGLLIPLVAVLAACSPSRMAADLAASAMTGGGGVYAREEDPELLLAALPFGLKTMEGLIEVSPDNPDLRLSAARGFASYAFLLRALHDAEAGLGPRKALDRRTARLFLRARDQAMAAIEIRHPGFSDDLRRDSAGALAPMTPGDAPFLYWAGAAWLGGISADKRDLEMVASLPAATAIVGRALALDETVEEGGGHEILMLLLAARAGADPALVDRHYDRAVALSGGGSAGVHVSFAESVAVARQDRAAFDRALEAALAVDTDAYPDRRLANIVAQRRARLLQAQADDLFIAIEGASS